MEKKETVSAFWWNARSNFGDALTPYLLEAFADVKVDHADAAEADIVVVGSILEALPTHWNGIVAGSGKLYEKTRPNLDNAHVYGLRGTLSAQGVTGEYALGDPALLIDEMIPAGKKEHELGVVPHWSDTVLVGRFAKWNPHVILPSGDPLTVVREIASCKKIVASSLHGIIVADAYGIPRRAEMFAQAAVEGGDFKFRDYASVINQPIVFGQLQTPYRWRIEELQRGLWDMFKRIGEAV